ncbi:MAG: DUF4367 domain-containing protein [Ruminococcus sp.]|nr:DUF4367 domain-containing protein [Ruminococcus sp.]
MLNSNKLHTALEMSIKDMNAAYDENEVISHRFSWRYKRKKRAIIKAYQQSLQRPEEFDSRYRKISFRQKVLIATIAVVMAALLTGAGVVVTYYIGGIRAEQQSTHTDAFAMDWESAPLTLEKTYRITYDLSDYEMNVMSDYDFSYWEVYRRNDEYINYIYQTKEVYQNSRLNTEGTHIEKREVCGYDALYFEHSDGSKCLIWDNGEYIFELQFNGDYDYALDIAQSIKEV